MKVRPLNKDWQCLVDPFRKVQSKRDDDKIVHRLRRKRLELTQLLHDKVKRGEFSAQGVRLTSWDNRIHMDCWEEGVNVQQELKSVDLLDCCLLHLQV